MKYRYLTAFAVAAIICVASAGVLAADPPASRADEVIYGREVTTEQQRTHIRAEHHAALQKRAP